MNRWVVLALAAVVVALAWSVLGLHALALVVGIALIARGALRLVAALGEQERPAAILNALTSAIAGLLALAWPSVTVLVLALAFALLAIGRIVPLPPLGRRLRLVAAGAGFALALGAVALSAALHGARPAAPGAFYTPPRPLPPGPPGTIIRRELVDGFQPGATTYRVLYKSTSAGGRPIAVSGLVLVPDGPAPPGGRPVLAYTHGTTGVASNCAPSLQDAAAQPLFFEGGAAFLKAGYVVAATDFEGLGTPGPHPYLIGASEGRNALDSVRAARRIAHASATFAIWGHSQGGQAALFTAQLAASYAPELDLVGVAAGAPASDLVSLFKVNVDTLIGKVLVSMALSSWARVYHDAHLDDVVAPASRRLVREIAQHCLYNQKQIVASVPSALLLKLRFISAPPWTTEPWKTISEQNMPGAARVAAPILITQGGADKIIPPQVQARFAQRLCALGDRVELRTLAGVGHLDGGHQAAAQVERWIADRFAGRSVRDGCCRSATTRAC